MTHTLKNLSRRLVSFRGNSGETWHIPPSTSIELPDFEVSENAMFHKLKELRLIGEPPADTKRDEPPDTKRNEPPDTKRNEPPDTKRHEPDDDDNDRGKKARAKR